MFVERRCCRSSVKDSLSISVMDMWEGNVSGRVISVSMIQATRSSTHRTDPLRRSTTSV